MHPAISVIFFTVTSGAGFGFIFLIGLGVPLAAGSIMAFVISALAVGLCVAGLVSSTFHLGHPERAWRAFSQWRSSWLSREGVLSVATLLAFALYALFWIFSGERIAVLGILVSALALSTIYATAMIYAQLKTVPSWYTWLTPACYLGFGIASAMFLALVFGANNFAFAVIALVANLMAWIIKGRWWQRADNTGFYDTRSTTGTATGLGHLGDVQLLEKPHSGENYLTKEMVHQIGRKHAQKLRIIALIAGALIPAFLWCIVIVASLPYAVLLLGFISMLIGLFAERWLFFAEAKHTVSLYY